MNRPSRRQVLIALAALLLAPPRSGIAEADPRAPEQVVADFHATLLGVMKEAGSLGIEGRFARLAPALDRTFDLARMTRIVSGRHWRKADAPAQQRAVAAFRRFSIATYAAQFDGFSGRAFESVGTKPGPQDTMLVITRIAKQSATEADLTYVLKREAGEAAAWRVVDVLLDNSISQLAVRRSEYRQTLKQGGLARLSEALDAGAERLLGG